MRVIATISDTVRLAIVIDLLTGEVREIPVLPEFANYGRVGRELCYPFGITWTDENLFVSNNEQLLMFDKNLEFVRVHKTQLQKNIHQLAFRDGRVWAVSPWTNSVIGVSIIGKQPDLELFVDDDLVLPYVERESNEGADRCHLNSILWTHKSMYVAAHNLKNPSKIHRFEADTLKRVKTFENVGSAMHGLALDGDEMFWISSGTDELKSNKGLILPLGTAGFPRGLIVTQDVFVVTVSEFLSRHERWGGWSRLIVLDRRDHSVIDELHFADTGSINDIRLLDGDDYAHGVKPFHSPVVETSIESLA
jgi:hypothetical protein